jgi:hypothetical protein
VDPERLWDATNCQIAVEAKAGIDMPMLEILKKRLTGEVQTSAGQGALGDSAMSAEIRVWDLPPVMTAGYSYRVAFSILNKGSAPWPSLAGEKGFYAVQVGEYWRETSNQIEQRGYRTKLRWDLLPGNSWSDALIVTAPAKPGTYRVGIDLLQVGVGWFHERGSLPAEFSVLVNARKPR